MRQARIVISFAFILGLGSCQVMQEMGKALDRVGADLVRSLAAPRPAPAPKLEITQPLPAELETRRQAGQLRAAVVVSETGLCPSAPELLRGCGLPMQGAALVLAAESADAEAWFASLPERAALTELPESELLVGAHVQSTAGGGQHLEVRAFDRAATAWVFAARIQTPGAEPAPQDAATPRTTRLPADGAGQ